MHRIPEPELMKSHQQVKAYAEADFSSSDFAMLISLEEYILSVSKVINEKSLIIDLGCGPGNITERIACRWPLSRVIGIDGSEEMLSVAKARKSKFESLRNLKGLSYLQEDLASLSANKPIFKENPDVITSNSVLHHVHDPNMFWGCIKNLSKVGTVIFQKDLRRPPSIEEAIRLQEKYQPNSPSILKRDFLASLRAAFTLDEVQAQLEFAGLYQLKVFEVDDRYLEIIGVL